MTDTTTTTRQRLLDLWEKCPECKPYHDPALHRDVWSMHEALARDAMMQWLAVNGFAPQLSHDVVFRLTIGRDDCHPEMMEFPGLTDALISAVEAVMEKKDD